MEDKNIMMLEFKLEKQSIRRLDRFRPVEGSSNYLYAHFNFDEDWKDLHVEAIFKYGLDHYYVEVKPDGTCKVPEVVIRASRFTVSCVGSLESETRLVTADCAEVGVSRSIGEGQASPFVAYINSTTLNVDQNGDVAKIEIPNKYGIKLAYNSESSTIDLLGRNLDGKDEDRNLKVLSTIDLPLEKILSNIYFDEVEEEIIFEFENSDPIRINIFDHIKTYLTDFIKKSDADKRYVHQEIGKGLSDQNFTKEEKIKLSTLENYNDTELRSELNGLDLSKQEKLVSGVNLSTINGQSLLKGNDIVIGDSLYFEEKGE